mmetsp:Transcript_27612/g.50273  ORF Transcript_27612/g.50273 Transcript_27612/m.50273 type:complete len:98 (+) Transcript_27612:543-836(+)
MKLRCISHNPNISTTLADPVANIIADRINPTFARPSNHGFKLFLSRANQRSVGRGRSRRSVRCQNLSRNAVAGGQSRSLFLHLTTKFVLLLDDAVEV